MATTSASEASTTAIGGATSTTSGALEATSSTTTAKWDGGLLCAGGGRGVLGLGSCSILALLGDLGELRDVACGVAVVSRAAWKRMEGSDAP